MSWDPWTATHWPWEEAPRARRERNPLAEWVEHLCTPPLTLTDGALYLIGGAGLVKIGRTTRPVAERLAQLQTGSPVPLRIISLCEHGWAEQELHNSFARARVHGEWFDPALHPRLRQLVGNCEAHMAKLAAFAEEVEAAEGDEDEEAAQ